MFKGLEEVAAYQAAYPTANMFLFFTTIIVTVFVPLVAEIWEKKHIKFLKILGYTQK